MNFQPPISPYSQPGVFCVGGFYGFNGLTKAMIRDNSANGNAVWPAANRALYLPFTVHQTISIDTIGIYNGTVAGGNRDVGIYDGKSLALLVSSGSTAASGTSQLQKTTFTATVLIPGFYFAGVAFNTNTDSTFRYAPTLLAMLATGMRQEESALPLPSTMTPVDIASAYVPLVALFKTGFPA